jgi:ketosteroid isomerase-like protein
MLKSAARRAFMTEKEPVAVVLDFMERINSGNVDSICAAMTPDHVFVDALGARFVSRETMRIGWRMYHEMIPDYKVSHEEIFAKGDTVAVFGTARGTLALDGTSKKENFWEIPAAWKAIVRDGLVAHWQVFADNQPVRKLMGDSAP